jgi:hypothetical protein
MLSSTGARGSGRVGGGLASEVGREECRHGETSVKRRFSLWHLTSWLFPPWLRHQGDSSCTPANTRCPRAPAARARHERRTSYAHSPPVRNPMRRCAPARHRLAPFPIVPTSRMGSKCEDRPLLCTPGPSRRVRQISFSSSRTPRPQRSSKILILNSRAHPPPSARGPIPAPDCRCSGITTSVSPLTRPAGAHNLLRRIEDDASREEKA